MTFGSKDCFPERLLTAREGARAFMEKLIVQECKTQKRYMGNKYLEAWLYLTVISNDLI